MSKLIDIKGQRFRRLKVLRKSKDANLWVCRCSCGKIVEHSGYRLRNGCVKSCGCLKIETTRKLRSIDLTGKTFGRWTVLEYRAGGYCLCRCTCGRKKLLLIQSLRDGRSQSCGCLHKEIVSRMNFLDLTGRSFGRLTVIDRAPNQKRRVYWNCQCSCGSLKAIQAGLLIDGRTQSCGCLRREWIEQNARRFGFKPGHRMAPEMRAAVNRKFCT